MRGWIADAVRRDCCPRRALRRCSLLPYLPWLPDALPVLRLLAGPGRALIWFTVFALIARGFWRALPPRARVSPMRPPHVVAAALFVIGTLISGAHRPALFTRTILFPGGDEPHYLVIAQSLWRDGDLKIENNHTRGDYREYFEGDLRPHYLRRGDGSRDLFDPPDRRVRAADADLRARRLHAGGVDDGGDGERGGRAGLARWRTATSGSRTAATMAWLACCVNGPWVFNSFAVYPEVPAALAVMCAWLAMTGAAHRQAAPGRQHGTLAALDAVRPGDRDAAVVQHEIRADGGRASPRSRCGRLWWPGDLSEEQPLRDRRRRLSLLAADRDQPRRLVHVLLRDLGHVVAVRAVRLAARNEAGISAVGRPGAAVRSGIRRDRVRARAVPRADRPRRDARGARTRAAARDRDAVRGRRAARARSARSTSGGAAARRSDGRSSPACCCSRCRSRIASSSSARSPR